MDQGGAEGAEEGEGAGQEEVESNDLSSTINRHLAGLTSLLSLQVIPAH